MLSASGKRPSKQDCRIRATRRDWPRFFFAPSRSLFHSGLFHESQGRQETLSIWILPAKLNLIRRFEGLVRLFQISRHVPVVSKKQRLLKLHGSAQGVGTPDRRSCCRNRPRIM